MEVGKGHSIPFFLPKIPRNVYKERYLMSDNNNYVN